MKDPKSVYQPLAALSSSSTTGQYNLKIEISKQFGFRSSVKSKRQWTFENISSTEIRLDDEVFFDLPDQGERLDHAPAGVRRDPIAEGRLKFSRRISGTILPGTTLSTEIPYFQPSLPSYLPELDLWLASDVLRNPGIIFGGLEENWPREYCYIATIEDPRKKFLERYWRLASFEAGGDPRPDIISREASTIRLVWSFNIYPNDRKFVAFSYRLKESRWRPVAGAVTGLAIPIGVAGLKKIAGI